MILRTLTGWYAKNGKKGWPNHPVTKMWYGYEIALVEYAFLCLIEYDKRKKNTQSTLNRSDNIIDALDANDKIWFEYMTASTMKIPTWLGNEKFHSSHRAALLAKMPEWYNQFGWTETPEIKYFYLI